MSGKTAIKTAKPSPRNGNALPLGNHPGNTGGKKGRSGRKPNAFKNFLAQLRADPLARTAFETAARDATNRNFSSAWKLMADYDDEKPAEKHAIVGPVVVHVRIAREGRRVTAS
jgi:hypothetical protein